jgi:hypothetical protein
MYTKLEILKLKAEIDNCEKICATYVNNSSMVKAIKSRISELYNKIKELESNID